MFGPISMEGFRPWRIQEIIQNYSEKSEKSWIFHVFTEISSMSGFRTWSVPGMVNTVPGQAIQYWARLYSTGLGYTVLGQAIQYRARLYSTVPVTQYPVPPPRTPLPPHHPPLPGYPPTTERYLLAWYSTSQRCLSGRGVFARLLSVWRPKTLLDILNHGIDKTRIDKTRID